MSIKVVHSGTGMYLVKVIIYCYCKFAFLAFGFSGLYDVPIFVMTQSASVVSLLYPFQTDLFVNFTIFRSLSGGLDGIKLPKLTVLSY